MVPARRSNNSSPVRTETPVRASSTERVKGEPVTMISSEISLLWALAAPATDIRRVGADTLRKMRVFMSIFQFNE